MPAKLVASCFLACFARAPLAAIPLQEHVPRCGEGKGGLGRGLARAVGARETSAKRSGEKKEKGSPDHCPRTFFLPNSHGKFFTAQQNPKSIGHHCVWLCVSSHDRQSVGKEPARAVSSVAKRKRRHTYPCNSLGPADADLLSSASGLVASLALRQRHSSASSRGAALLPCRQGRERPPSTFCTAPTW